MATALSVHTAVPLQGSSRPAVRLRAAESARPGGAAIRAGRRPTAPPAPVRLTRRGRVVVFALLLCLAIGAVSAVAVASSAASAGTPPRHATTVVGAGDTLWGIATAWDPAGDPRETIAELRRLNGLSGSTVDLGQELILPAR
jgi:LysM repeat protein